jgi:hypothetical protein
VIQDATGAVLSKPRGSFVLVLDSHKPERDRIRYDFACSDETVPGSADHGNAIPPSGSAGER